MFGPETCTRIRFRLLYDEEIIPRGYAIFSEDAFEATLIRTPTAACVLRDKDCFFFKTHSICFSGQPVADLMLTNQLSYKAISSKL